MGTTRRSRVFRCTRLGWNLFKAGASDPPESHASRMPKLLSAKRVKSRLPGELKLFQALGAAPVDVPDQRRGHRAAGDVRQGDGVVAETVVAAHYGVAERAVVIARPEVHRCSLVGDQFRTICFGPP